MRLFIRLVSINALLCIFGIHLPINSSELKSLISPEINSKDKLFNIVDDFINFAIGKFRSLELKVLFNRFISFD